MTAGFPQESTPVPGRVSNLEKARALYGSRADYFIRFLNQSDPLADAAVEALHGLPSRADAHRVIDEALERGIDRVSDAPPALRALFAQVDHVPEWVDWKRMRLGARTYQRTGIAGSIVLSALSLMNGYHSAAATKPLLFTGRLDAMARRRLAETGGFIVDATQVNGLRRFNAGFKTTVKVRLVHATVRRFLLRSPEWKTAEWGLPINQADMAATTLSFSVAMLYGTRAMGFRFAQEEADALMHLWKYNGYLSGVEPGLLFDSETEAMSWAELIDLLQPGPDEGSIALAQALRNVNFQRPANAIERIVTPWLVRYHDGLTRYTAGDDVADDLGIPNRMWKYAIPLTRVALGPVEGLRARIPGLTYATAVLGNWMVSTAVKKELQGLKPDFRPPADVGGARAPAH